MCTDPWLISVKEGECDLTPGEGAEGQKEVSGVAGSRCVCVWGGVVTLRVVTSV